MKKLACILSLSTSTIIIAQSADFKKNYEDGNLKYKTKSYSLAILSYDKAIAAVHADAEAALKAKTALPADKKYIAEAYARRAASYYNTGNTGNMKADAEKALVLDPGNADAKALAAYSQYKAGNKKDACKTMRLQVGKQSEVAAKVFEDCFCWSEGVTLAKEGITQGNLKRYDEALTKFDEAAVILPDSGFIYAERAKIYLEKGDAQKAIADVNTAIAKKTRNYKMYYMRAQAFMETNKFDSAYDDMTTCLDLKPDFYDGYVLRAELSEKMERWNAAIYDYNILIKLRPDFGMTYYKAALVKQNYQNDLLGACDMYTAAANRGVEEAKEMAANCANPKYMKKNLQKAGN